MRRFKGRLKAFERVPGEVEQPFLGLSHKVPRQTQRVPVSQPLLVETQSIGGHCSVADGE